MRLSGSEKQSSTVNVKQEKKNRRQRISERWMYCRLFFSVCVCVWEAVSFIGLGSVQSPGDYITPGPSGNVCACVCADARARRERWRARLLRLSKRDFVFVRPVISAYRNQFSPS